MFSLNVQFDHPTCVVRVLLLHGEVGSDKCFKMLSFSCFQIHLHYLLNFFFGGGGGSLKLHNTFELHLVLCQLVCHRWGKQ